MTTKTIKSTAKTFAQEWRESIVENLPTIHYVKGNETRPALAAADLQAGMTIYATGNCVDSIITSVEPSKTGKTVTISDRTCGGRTRTYRKNASTIIELANDTREKYRRLAEMAERVAKTETEATETEQVAADAVKTESKSVKATEQPKQIETTEPTLAASIAAILLALATIAEHIADITLTGSPKQVAWASDIRSGWLNMIAQTLRSALDDAIAGHDLPQVEYAVHASVQCVAALAGCTSARSIIDARYASDVYDLQFKPLGCDSAVEQELIAAGKAATEADIAAVLDQPKSEADQLADALVAAGGKRWTRGQLDRVYVDAETLGLDYDCYKSGNIRSASWQGEGISNADARRLLGSKVYVDLTADAELHVETYFRAGYGQPELEEAAQAWLDAATAEANETDEAIITEADETTDETEETVEIEFVDGTIRTTTEADVQAIGHTMAEAYDLAVSMMASAASIRVTWLRGNEVVAETRTDHEPTTDEGSDEVTSDATYYSAEQIAALEAVGFRRWQKFGHDRLYYDGDCFSSSIYALYSDATAKAWVDLKTGDLRARTTPRSIEGHVLDRVGGIMHDALLALEVAATDDADDDAETITTTLTEDEAHELHHLRSDMAWSWYELAQRYGVTEAEARRVYDGIHRGLSVATVSVETAEYVADLDREIEDAEAELEAADEEYREAESENVDAHSHPDCFEVDASDRHLAEAEQALDEARQALARLHDSRADYIANWTRYELATTGDTTDETIDSSDSSNGDDADDASDSSDDADKGTQIIDADHVDHRHVGAIERDGWRYPVTHDETGYHVDLGGAIGVSDGIDFGSDEDALAGIAAMLDAEDEDAADDGMAATPRPPPTPRPFLPSSTRRKE